MWGGSYFGYTQWVLADQIDPGPMALMVQLASTDMHAMLYPGGAFSLQSALTWALWTADRRDIEPPPEVFERGYGGFPLVEADDRAGQHRLFDDWVTTRAATRIGSISTARIARRSEAPVLLVAAGTIRSCRASSTISSRFVGTDRRGGSLAADHRPLGARLQRRLPDGVSLKLSLRAWPRPWPGLHQAPAGSRGDTAGSSVRHGRACLARRTGMAVETRYVYFLHSGG
jgi:hypothetical protein